jgi:hypothetical protein
MPEPKIRDRLVGGWRLTGYEVTTGGKTDHPLGEDPLYDDDDQPDAYYIAYSGPYDVDETNQIVAHHVQVSVIPSWLGTAQLRQVRFHGSDTLALSASEPGADGVTSTTTIHWARQPPR